MAPRLNCVFLYIAFGLMPERNMTDSCELGPLAVPAPGRKNPVMVLEAKITYCVSKKEKFMKRAAAMSFGRSFLAPYVSICKIVAMAMVKSMNMKNRFAVSRAI